jgi:hypothetical protein
MMPTLIRVGILAFNGQFYPAGCKTAGQQRSLIRCLPRLNRLLTAIEAADKRQHRFLSVATTKFIH